MKAPQGLIQRQPGSLHSDENQLLASYENARILITGASGYIGSRLVRTLQTVNCHMTLLVRPGREAATDADGPATVSVVSGDMLVRETWSSALEGASHVFHLAAQTSAYVADKEPFIDLDSNVMPVLHMLEECRRMDLATGIVFAGTATQVGMTRQTPVDESFPDRPVTIYDIHKLTAEQYLRYYAEGTAVKTVTLRLPNVYGPGPSSSSADRGLLNQMIRRALKGETLTVYGEGLPVRDYVFIDDVARAFLAAGSKIDALSGRYYVIGSGTGTRLVDAVNLVRDRVELRTGRSPKVVHVQPPTPQLAIEERNFVADTRQFTSAAGWSPRVSLADGIDRTIEFFLAESSEGPAT